MLVADPRRPRIVLIADSTELDALVAFARDVENQGEPAASHRHWQPLALLELTTSSVFRPRPSTILVPGMPAGTIACVPVLDEWGIASRLASPDGYPGCYEGGVIELAATWLGALDADALSEVALFAWGGAALLADAAEVARRFDLPYTPGVVS
jgi:dihydroorotate dehydrogenase electron transfer subunit